ncbi:hypothetical protein [Paenibacillus sp. NPDC057967]|uniref:hypothetical protein n=1 Tax=Paenibacillus sp. NPDC057967 TaxID=3346293 RepID=UPI0036DF7532
MLNGKKSYLLSITALFSEKGYELVVGLNYLVDINNQYHLTAPIISTYRAFIEDTMKSAGKVSSTATGTFGQTYRADLAYEPEGIEVETVLATVVNYLNDIHGLLSGESSTQKAPIAEFGEHFKVNMIDTANALIESGADFKRKDTLDAEYTEFTNSSDVAIKVSLEEQIIVDEKMKDVGVQALSSTKYVYDVLDMWEVEDFAHSEKVVSESFAPIKEILANERQKVSQDVEALSDTLNMSKEFAAEVEDFTGGYKDETFQGGTEVVRFSHTRRLHETVDGEIEEFSNTPNVTGDIKEAIIQDFTAGESMTSESEVVLESFRSVTGRDAEASRPEDLTEAPTYTAGLAELMELTDVGMDSAVDAELNDYQAAESHSDAGGYVDTIGLAENIKHTVASDPEVTKVARLMEIMYGSKVFEYIESGIEEIVMNASQGDLSEATVSMIRDSVLEEVQRASGGNRMDAVEHGTEVAEPSGDMQGVRYTTEVAEPSGDRQGMRFTTEVAEPSGRVEAIENVPERAETQSPFVGVTYLPEYGEMTGAGNQAFIHDIGKAIAQANSKLAERHNPEYATNTIFGDGVLQETEVAETGLTDIRSDRHVTEVGEYHDRFNDYVVHETEVAQYRDIFTYQNENDSTRAKHITEYEAVGQETETAFYKDRDFEYVTHGDTLAYSSSNFDATSEETRYANVEAPNHDAILHEIGRGDVLAPEQDSIFHQTEVAESVHVNDVVIDRGDVSKGETVLDSVKHEDGSTYIGDVIMPAVMTETEAGQSETVLNAITHQGIDADNVLSVNGGEVETTIEADSVVSTGGADVEDLSEALRQRKTLETTIQEDTDSSRKRVQVETAIEESADAERKRIVHDTDIIESSESSRIKEAIETTIEEGENGSRHRVIETEIAEAEEGKMITHPESKKSRLWLIIGKIASWSIWNWKKTR